MTQSPHLPSNGGQDPQTGEWESTGSPASTFGSTAAGERYPSAGTGTSAGGSAKQTAQQTAGTAKSEATDLKNTAVDKGQQVAGVAKEQASAVKDTALDKGQQVAGVAKEQVANVAAEAGDHARDLLQQGRSEISSQLATQQQRLGTLVHSLAEELGSMGSSAEHPGPLSGLAKQGSRTVGNLAQRLENSDPSELLDDLRNLARRRPVVFLSGAALAGILVGRLSRNLASEAHDTKVANETRALPASSYDSGSYTTGGYETGTYTAGAPASGNQSTTAYDDTTSYSTGRGDYTR